MESWRTHNPRTGTESYLLESTWEKHTARRPEIRNHLFAVEETVWQPDFTVTRRHAVTTRHDVFTYRMGYGSGKTTGLWLVVIEEPDPRGEHRVKTVYFTADVVEGTLRVADTSMEEDVAARYTREQVVTFQNTSRYDRELFIRNNRDLEAVLKNNDVSIEYVEEHDHLYIGVGAPQEGMALFINDLVAIAEPDTWSCIGIEVPNFSAAVDSGRFSRGGRKLRSLLEYMPAAHVPQDAPRGTMPAILAEDLHRELVLPLP